MKNSKNTDRRGGKSWSGKPQPPRQDKGKPGPQRIAADLWGTHAVREAWLNPARKIRGLYVTEQALKSFEDILDQRKTPPSLIEKAALDRLLPPGAVHQGIALHSEPLPEVFVQDMIIMAKNNEKAGKKTTLVMLDQVTDPHNVGAILRSACVFGAAGMILQRKHSPELGGILAKTACGAVEHVPVAYEINLSDTLDKLRDNGFFAIGLDERGENEMGALQRHENTVIVLGAEGKGLRPKVREHCDALARLPVSGPIASLNVSNAAAVALYALDH